jgi:hypothetical protein
MSLLDFDWTTKYVLSIVYLWAVLQYIVKLPTGCLAGLLTIWHPELGITVSRSLIVSTKAHQ